MDGLLESFSSAPEEGSPLRFDSFLLSSPSFRCCLSSRIRRTPLFSRFDFVFDSKAGYSLNLNVFFFLLPRIRGLMIQRRSDADRTMLVRMNISFDTMCILEGSGGIEEMEVSSEYNRIRV